MNLKNLNNPVTYQVFFLAMMTGHLYETLSALEEQTIQVVYHQDKIVSSDPLFHTKNRISLVPVKQLDEMKYF